MRLNEKLIRKNCPSCESEITLETSSLDKKILCPKCRQTVIIPNGRNAPEKPAARKPASREKRAAAVKAGVLEKSPPAPMEMRIAIQRRDVAWEAAVAPPQVETILPEKRAVVYCICNGVLKRCDNTGDCCVKGSFCIYADELHL